MLELTLISLADSASTPARTASASPAVPRNLGVRGAPRRRPVRSVVARRVRRLGRRAAAAAAAAARAFGRRESGEGARVSAWRARPTRGAPAFIGFDASEADDGRDGVARAPGPRRRRALPCADG